jgi:hypothetical protein
LVVFGERPIWHAKALPGVRSANRTAPRSFQRAEAAENPDEIVRKAVVKKK